MHVYLQVMLILMLFWLADCRPTDDTCNEPNLKQSCINTHQNHESFLLIQPRYKQTNDIEYFKNIRTTPVPGDNKQCAWQTTGKYNSTCPHHYVINRDENRRPMELIEAKCNCNKDTPCLDGDNNSRCVPVKYYINVLRKNKCEDGVYGYIQTIEPITVGCTCSHPVRHSTRIRYFMNE